MCKSQEIAQKGTNSPLTFLSQLFIIIIVIHEERSASQLGDNKEPHWQWFSKCSQELPSLLSSSRKGKEKRVFLIFLHSLETLYSRYYIEHGYFLIYENPARIHPVILVLLFSWIFSTFFIYELTSRTYILNWFYYYFLQYFSSLHSLYPYVFAPELCPISMWTHQPISLSMPYYTKL